MSAFHGDVAVRDALVARLSEALATQTFLPDADERLHEGVSLIAALIGERDLDRFEAKTGIPASLGLFFDDVLRGMAHERRDAARALAQDWLAAIPVGGDLVPTVSQITVWLVDQAIATSPAAAAGAALDRVRALHLAHLAGADVARRDWAATRNEALALADATDEGADRQCAEFAAMLAWPADRSRTILAEGARALSGLQAWLAVDRAGWTSARRRESDRVMQEIWADTADLRERDPAGYDFHPHFLAAQPAMAQGFVDALQLEGRSYTIAIAEIGNAVTAMIAAPSSRPITGMGMTASAADPRN